MSDAWSQLPELLAAHTRLALASLALAVGLGLPLGVLAHRKPRIGRVVVAVASVIQTIPALALLAIMVPLLASMLLPSIGPLPALLALVLYGLLPIVQNTLAGLAGVDRRVVQAARGVGMTDRQRLVQVELPLALPVLMAGIRTATVWTVGMATLSTPVGAPSLGNLIFSGLQTRNHGSVLVGCLAAATLALVLDGLLRLSERGARPGGSGARTWTPLVAVGAIGIAAIVPLVSNGGVAPLRIGAKTFTEQYVLAAVLDDAAREAGVDAEIVSSLGSTVAFDALADGAIDLYVDYSGTLWATVMNRPTEGVSRAEVLARTERWLREEKGIELVCELGFENTYALVMRGDESLESIDALSARAPELEIGGDYELFERPEWQSLETTYGLRFAEERAMDPSLMYEALARGDVDVIGAYSTDGRIAAHGFAVLDDPRGVIPPYDAVLLARRGLTEERPALVRALRARVCDAIDAPTMRELNRLVDADGRSPADAAATLRRAKE